MILTLDSFGSRGNLHGRYYVTCQLTTLFQLRTLLATKYVGTGRGCPSWSQITQIHQAKPAR